MGRLIAWLTHLVSSIAAINWGLWKFFQFNLVDYIAEKSQIAFLGELSYAIIMIFGIISFTALFTRRPRRK